MPIFFAMLAGFFSRRRPAEYYIDIRQFFIFRYFDFQLRIYFIRLQVDYWLRYTMIDSLELIFFIKPSDIIADAARLPSDTFGILALFSARRMHHFSELRSAAADGIVWRQKVTE